MGLFFSTFEEMRQESAMNKLLTEVVAGNDDTPLSRPDEQLAELPERLARLASIYRLNGRQLTVNIIGVWCKNLRNVELMGSNDPYAKFQFGAWSDKTEYQDGAGAEAEWSNLKMSFATSDRGLALEELKLQVLDYNSLRAHVVVGEASVNLSSLCNQPLGKALQISVDLKDSQGQQAGEVALEIRLDLSLDIFIKKISCSELKNVEFFGSNDPYVLLEFGSWTGKTEYQDGAGAEATWPDPRLSFQATKRALSRDSLQISVLDYNHITAHALIGSVAIRTEPLLHDENTTDHTVKLKADIVDKRGKKAGVVELLIRVRNPEDVSAVNDDDDNDELAGDNEESVLRSLASPTVETDLQTEAIRLMSEMKVLSDWGGNWRLMSQPNSNVIYTAAAVILKDYGSYAGQDAMHYATIFASDKRRVADETSVRALQLLKNLSSSNITGVYVTMPEFCVLQAITILYLASAGSKRKTRRNQVLLEDIETMCWYLIDSHLERRDVPDLDRMLVVLQHSVNDRTAFTVDPPLREYIFCMLFTFKTFVYKHLVHDEGEDLRQEMEIIALRYMINKTWSEETDIIVKLGMLRILTELSKNAFNRETLLLVDALSLVLHLLEGALKKLKKDVSYATIPDAFPVHNIRLEMYKSVNKAVDDPEMIKLNAIIERDRFSLCVKYCVTFCVRMLRYEGIIAALSSRRLESAVIRANGLLILSGHQSNAPDFAVLGLTSIACFAGTTEHGKIVNIFASPAGRAACRDLVYVIYLAAKRRFGPDLLRATSLRLNPTMFHSDNYKRRFVTITDVTCKNLRNVELMGSNDPYAKFQFGAWSDKTEYQDGAGAEAEWSNLKMSFATSDRGLALEELKLQVLDYNSLRAHVVIGEASVNLLSLCNQPLGKALQIFVDLKDNQGQQAGEVALSLFLSNVVITTIHSLKCSDLTNVEVMGHNDPFVELKFDSWSEQTEPQDDAGAQAKWHDLSISFQTTEKLLRTEKLFVSVYDHNSMRSHTLIGETVVDISTSLLAFNKEHRFSASIFDKKGRESGKISLSLDVEEAPDEVVNTIDTLHDPISLMDTYLEKSEGYQRLNHLAQEFCLSVGLKALLELVKNEVVEASVMTGQPLSILNICLQCFLTLCLIASGHNTKEKYSNLVPKINPYGTVIDGLAFEAAEVAAYSIEILIHLMSYVDVVSLNPLNLEIIKSNMQTKMDLALVVYKAAKAKCEYEKELSKAREEFESVRGQIQTEYNRQKSKVDIEAQWWLFQPQDQAAIELCATVDELSELQEELAETVVTSFRRKVRQYVLPPATRRHMHYLHRLLRRAELRAKGQRPPEYSVGKDCRTRVALVMSHTDDNDSLYLCRDSLHAKSGGRESFLLSTSHAQLNSLLASFRENDSIDFHTAELGALPSDGIPMQLNANIDPDGWRVDLRVNELLETLISSGLEVVVDKMQPPLQLMEALIVDDEGSDSRLALARSKIVWEVLTDEVLSTCAAVLICVRAKATANPGLRYVCGAAEAVRHQMTLDTMNIPEKELDLQTRRLPLKIFFLVTDTGESDDGRVKKTASVAESLGDIHYDGWVRDAMAPKPKIGYHKEESTPMGPEKQQQSEMDYHDILYEEEGRKEEELVLPLWAKEHIEATAMYVKQALY